MQQILMCPVCQAALSKEEKRYVCEKGHSFDVSSKRYVNLLVGADGAVHGDNKEMILARHRFLYGNWYASLLAKIKELCVSVFPQSGVLLDSGCGEGYYTAGICAALQDAHKTSRCIGIDISKDAVIEAGKTEFARSGMLELAVASVYHMPILDESCDMVTSFFAPLCDESFKRVLKKGGHLLLAVPGKKHLWGLKEVLYDTPYENEVKDPALDGFTLVKRCTVEENVTFGKEAFSDLFAMTPYGYRTPKAGRDRLAAKESLETLISFELFLYTKD